MTADGDLSRSRPRRLQAPFLGACLLLAGCGDPQSPSASLSYDLEQGEFLQVSVEQLGTDVALELRDQRDRLVARVDSPNGAQGTEDLVAIAKHPGRHSLEVRSDAAPGMASYRISHVERRPATSDDRALVAADNDYRKGRALAREGHLDEAIGRFRAAFPTFERLGLPGRQAAALLGLCEAHEALGKLQVAVAFCDRAVEHFREQPDPYFLGAALRVGGLLRVRLGQPERALQPLTDARRLFESAGAPEAAALSLSYLAAAHQVLGRYPEAALLFEEALARSDTLDQADVRASIRVDAGNLLLLLSRPRDALELFEQALELYRGLGGEAEVGTTLRGVARAAIHLGAYDRAQAAIEEALALVEGDAERDTRIANLTTFGSLLRLRGQADRGRKVLEEAAGLARDTGAVQREATALLELGYLEVAAGRPGEGLALLDQAGSMFRDVADPIGDTSARARGAEALRDLGRLEEAWDRLALALDAVEAQRASAGRRDVRAGIFAFRQDYFEIAIDLLMQMEERHPGRGFAREAFTVHERRLARELVETRSAAPAAPDPRLEAEAEELEARLRSLAMADRGAETEREIDAVLVQLAQVTSRASATAPGSPARTSPPMPDVAGLQRRLLGRGSLLLAFSLGEKRSFLWAVTREEFRAFTLPRRLEIEAVAQGFAEATRSPRLDRAETRDALGEKLAAMLLGPVAAELGASRLLLVPQGKLQGVPWAALPDPADPTGRRYLVEQHEIALLPSVATLAAIRAGPGAERREARGVTVFADPVYQPDDPRLPVPVEAPPTAWARLAHAEDEAEAILAVSPSADDLSMRGLSACRESFEQAEWSRTGTLHFATHAEIDARQPELSRLVLSLFDEQGRKRDGSLRAFEISRLSLPVDLVVLSGCETGIGEELAGEGMASLARAFFEAGARRVVSSLWRVGDRSTARLMTRFYEGYRGRGLAPVAALAAAQRAMLAEPETSAPYRWAGFVVQGDGWGSP